MTITFSEAVSGFANEDVTVVAGTLGTLMSSDNITWTGTFTATDDSTTGASVTVSGAYADAVSNVGVTGANDTATVDTTNPTATVAITEAALSDTSRRSIVTITFSEAVTGFANEDLTIVGGTLSTIGSIDGGTTWAGIFTATDDSTTGASVTVSGAYTDLVSNVEPHLRMIRLQLIQLIQRQQLHDH